jgi:LmbE family N-acetylglucosaminyl deacetylase
MRFREGTRSYLNERLRRRLKPLDQADLEASAIIFAPHPDDETLGCGGVACQKIIAGADLHFVFVTDGAASHNGRVDLDQLRRQRAVEALEAVRCLGGTPNKVKFLRIPDGKAGEHIETIVSSVARLLNALRPESIFVIHSADTPLDHAAVHRSVLQAARFYGRPITVYEYPVWYWYHWPWVRFGADLPGMWRTTLAQSITTAAGLRALLTFNARADIADVMPRKRAALAAHVSQTSRPPNQPDWPILADLAGGEFIQRFNNDYEAFTRYELNA